MTSTAWMVAIIAGALFGGGLVAIANVNYNRALETENNTAKAKQAQEFLGAELRQNQDLLTEIDAAAPQAIPLAAFDTTAWQTVSSGGLLLGLPSSEFGKLLETYSLFNRANSLQSKLLELSGGGAASALEGSGALRGKYLTQFRAVLDQLRPLLQSTNGTTSLR
jgi:hypothetical protein